jgi:cytidyltransferase-like protein
MVKVLLGGCFDLLHIGHIQQIKKAKELGDYLIINLSSDKQVRNKKGEGRPIIPDYERKEMLLALKEVDRVMCVKTDKLDLPFVLDRAEPDILIANEGCYDYDEECEKRGIKVVKLPRCIPKSKLDTTGIINKIKKGG